MKVTATNRYSQKTVEIKVIPAKYRIFTVCRDGFITSITGEIGNPHRFFDHNGVELTFNDPKIADKKWMTNSDIIIDDRLFMNISRNDVRQAINAVPQNSQIIERRLQRLQRGYILIRNASNREADFVISFLIPHYDRNRNTEIDAPSYIYKIGTLRTRYQEDFIYFRFEGSNILYNAYDAGNFMWGAWTKLIGLSDREVEIGSNLNEWYRLGDSKADQRAIGAGRAYL
jgi:hypothetical protein